MFAEPPQVSEIEFVESALSPHRQAAAAQVRARSSLMGKVSCYNAIKRISTLTEPCLVGFSTGRDSVVMLDLLMKNYRGKMTFIYYYFVPNLDYKEKLLRYYESKYDIKIERRPHWITLSYMLGRRVEQGDVMKNSRHEFDLTYFALGTRRSESLTRRGQLAHIYDIDEKFKYFYPVIDFTTKQIDAYVKMNNLVIGDEYRQGFKHDLSVPDNMGLLYIKNQYPDDYKKIIQTFPQLEAGIKRIEMYGVQNGGK